MELSLAQKIAKFFSSDSFFEKMKEDSQKWKFDCDCGKTSNIWEIGGIRYKARGEQWSGIKCPACGKFAMRKVYREKENKTT
jgi:hypothetical protein